MSSGGPIALFVLAFAGFLSARTAQSSDVVAVRPGDPADRNVFIHFQQGGRVVIRSIPLHQIILWAGGTEIDLTGGPVDPNGPAFLTALREDLGLKLESTRGPVQVSVIDRVERPRPD